MRSPFKPFPTKSTYQFMLYTISIFLGDYFLIEIYNQLNIITISLKYNILKQFLTANTKYKISLS